MAGPATAHEYSVPDDPLPFDEDATRQLLTKTYEHFFDREREFYEGVSIFQLADEPGEIARESMELPGLDLLPHCRGRALCRRERQQQELTTRLCDLKGGFLRPGRSDREARTFARLSRGGRQRPASLALCVLEGRPGDPGPAQCRRRQDRHGPRNPVDRQTHGRGHVEYANPLQDRLRRHVGRAVSGRATRAPAGGFARTGGFSIVGPQRPS